MTTPSLSPLNPAQERQNDEIDLGEVLGTLRRRWRLVAGVAGGTVLLAGLYTLLQKPVWEGEIQIVLASNESGGGRLAQLAASNPLVANLAGLGSAGGKDSLQTEVKVLESPSVLRPVFDFVRSNKQRSGKNGEDLRYANWLKDNLDVKLEKGTSVLNIAYRDTSQDLVLPVIERISRAYQEYSGRDRRRDINNAVSYLKDRISDLEPKAEASMRRAQAFALANGLGLQDGMPTISTDGPSSGSMGGSVEASRMAAQANVIALRQQLANARAAGGAVLFQSAQLEANKDLYSQYQQIESQLAEKHSRLRDNDPIIRNLERQRRALATTLNRQTIDLLEGQLATAEAKLQSATRPKDVVLRHRELMRQALREEKTLTELENQLQLAQLEQAKQTEPWELISTPTLLDRPVAPRKGVNLALGLLAGLVLGSGTALVVDRRSGIVYSREELLRLLPYPLVLELDPAQPSSWTTPLQLLAEGPLAGAHSVALIPIGGTVVADIADHLSQALQKALERSSSAGVIASVTATADLMVARGADRQLLLTTPGAPTREELSQLHQQLELQDHPLTGLLLLRSTPQVDG